MLIFDRFENMEKAEEFAAYVTSIGFYAMAYPDRRDDIDPFPFELTGPVVYTDRDEGSIEDKIIATVAEYGGAFAGT